MYLLITVAVMYNVQQQMLQLLVENNLRGQKCEKMLQSLTEKTLQNMTMSISDINVDINSSCPEYLPSQTLADFHAAEDKWNTDKQYRKSVVSNI